VNDPMPMKIMTKKPDEQLYVRISPPTITPTDFIVKNLYRVAKVSSLSDVEQGKLGHDLIFIELDGKINVVNAADVEYISAREYFEGVLKHG